MQGRTILKNTQITPLITMFLLELGYIFFVRNIKVGYTEENYVANYKNKWHLNRNGLQSTCLRKYILVTVKIMA
jgi:hypothetical protein